MSKNRKPFVSTGHKKPEGEAARTAYFKSKLQKKAPKEHLKGGVFVYHQPLSVAQLAATILIPVVDIIKFLFLEGKMVNINTTLDDELIGLVCLNFGLDFKKEAFVQEEHFEDLEVVDEEKNLAVRPPVVTIMGHVDHGKTTLLDFIRKSHVTEGEFGGITQQIGAYQIDHHGQKITFLDTPGHEAFSAMRARGSQVTDIVIIVVAADDGVMPQTREAIDHAKAAQVPIIVAINKIDKPTADPEKVKLVLADIGLMPEEWGGPVIYKYISAKVGTGIDELLETILVVAEVNEIKANHNRYAKGTVIDARLEKGRGPVATLLIQNGTLRVGDSIVVGATFGKVRQMNDDVGRILKSAGPSTPCEVTGLEEVPLAGDHFMAFADEKQARNIADSRKTQKIENDRRGSSAPQTLDDLYKQIKDGEVQTINLIVKTDIQGSADAIKTMLEKIKVDTIQINVIRAQAGAITESDIILASASGAIVYGFNVRPDATVRKKAEEEKVEIRLHRIIYKMLEEIEAAMKGMLKPEMKEVVTGQAEVRHLFKVSKVGTIAGSYVTSGSIHRNNLIRLLREGVIIYEGKLGSLKRFQDDVKEVGIGYECGFTIENFNDIKEGDILEGYLIEEVKKVN